MFTSGKARRFKSQPLLQSRPTATILLIQSADADFAGVAYYASLPQLQSPGFSFFYYRIIFLIFIKLWGFWILPGAPLSRPKSSQELRTCGDHRPFLRRYQVAGGDNTIAPGEFLKSLNYNRGTTAAPW